MAKLSLVALLGCGGSSRSGSPRGDGGAGAVDASVSSNMQASDASEESTLDAPTTAGDASLGNMPEGSPMSDVALDSRAIQDSGIADSSSDWTAPDASSDAAEASVLDASPDATEGSASCPGSPVFCLGQDPTMCCNPDPSGPADCIDGIWICSSVGYFGQSYVAPACNGFPCIVLYNKPDASCGNVAPDCFGFNYACCESAPVAKAICDEGVWFCRADGPYQTAVVAPGCSGIACSDGED